MKFLVVVRSRVLPWNSHVEQTEWSQSFSSSTQSGAVRKAKSWVRKNVCSSDYITQRMSSTSNAVAYLDLI